MRVSSAGGGPEDQVARAYAQRFERGTIIYTCQAGTLTPDRWVVLFAERQGVRLWSFFDPARLGPAHGRRAGAALPPRGCHLPAPGFGVVWLALRDVLGWALHPAESCQLATQPTRLIRPNESPIVLHADRTWAVEAQAHESVF